jgi:DNA-binding response OmpR family regulator
LCDIAAVVWGGSGDPRAILKFMARNVLLVEDDSRVRRVLRLALEDEGYVVNEAADGAAAGLKALSRSPDVVLLDLMLPDSDGFAVCRSIRRVSDVPVIIITARVDSHDVVAGLAAMLTPTLHWARQRVHF